MMRIITTHTMYSHTVLIHCTHTIYSYTVLIHCTHTLYSYTVLIHCTHTMYSYYVLTLYSYNVPTPYSYIVLTQCTHTILIQCTMYSYTVLIHHTHTMYPHYTHTVHYTRGRLAAAARRMSRHGSLLTRGRKWNGPHVKRSDRSGCEVEITAARACARRCTSAPKSTVRFVSRSWVSGVWTPRRIAGCSWLTLPS
jgi:hypothetical protein